MKKALVFLIVMFISSIKLFAAHTVTYQIKVWHLRDETADIVETGKFDEGGEITIPPYALQGDIQEYQDLYNVAYQSRFGIQAGALTEDISITLNIMSFDVNTADYYFDHNLFFFMGVQVTGAESGFHDFDDTYSLREGYYAYINIPIDENLNKVLRYTGIDISEVDFAYYKDGAYDKNGISFENDGDFLKCHLTHFSKFGGGRHSAMPVELTDFIARVKKNKVELFWKTATEVNNYGFQVERQKAKGESNWVKVGFVEGSGNSNSPKQYFFTDILNSAGKYFYRLKQIDLDGSFEYHPDASGIEVAAAIPCKFELEQNYPNPFPANGKTGKPVTTIQYSISASSAFSNAVAVRLSVYDIRGREVATLVNEEQIPGNYSVEFNAADLPSGIYFYKLSAAGIVLTRKMLLLK